MKTAHRSILPILLIAGSLLGSCGGEGSDSGNTDSTRSDKGVTQAVMDSLTQVPPDLEKIDESRMIRYVFEKGDVVTYRIHSVTEVEEQTDTVVQRSKQDIAYTYRFDVLGSDAKGTGRLRVTCTRIVFHGQYGTREMRYDSKSPVDKNQEKMFAQYNAPLNTPFEMEVASEGTIQRVTKVEKVVQRLMGDDYKSASLDARKQITEDYGNHALKDIIQLVFQKLPENPVATDSSWSIVWDAAIGFLNVRNVGTYTLQGIRVTGGREEAHIGIRLETNYVGPPKLETGQGIATIDAFDVKGTGRTLFDVAANRTISRRMEQELLTRITVDPPKELKEQMPNLGLIRMRQQAKISTTIEQL